MDEERAVYCAEGRQRVLDSPIRVADDAAVIVYSMEGVAGLGGRLVFGIAADRFGAKRVLVIGLLIQAFAATSYLSVNQLKGFYAIAFVFGAGYGGVMPLYAAPAREAFGPRCNPPDHKNGQSPDRKQPPRHSWTTPSPNTS